VGLSSGSARAIGSAPAGASRAAQNGRRARLPLRTNVDLLAPVRLAARVLEAGAVVAAEMRRVDHLDRELVWLGQREKATRDAQRVINEFLIHTMADEIKKANAARCGAQFA
jgi:hypothetical protein